MRSFLFFISVLGVSACGFSVNNGSKKESRKDSWKYKFEENGCSTGEVSGEGKEAHCNALLDDGRNKGCARQLRLDAYKEICGETTLPQEQN